MENKSTYTLWKMYRYYKKRKKVSKIILNILSVLIFISFLLVIDTVDSIDLDAIPFKQVLIQYLINISFIAVSAYCSNTIISINETAIYRLKQIEKILNERKQSRSKERNVIYDCTASY